MIPVHPTVQALIDNERARSSAFDVALRDVESELRPILCDEHEARTLGLAIFAHLLDWCRAHSTDHTFATAMAEIAKLHELVAPSAINVPAARSHGCAQGDKLAARCSARVGHRGTWPPELRIPFEMATMLRRCLEERATKFLPLIVHEARWLVEYAGGSRGGVDQIVQRAVAPHLNRECPP